MQVTVRHACDTSMQHFAPAPCSALHGVRVDVAHVASTALHRLFRLVRMVHMAVHSCRTVGHMSWLPCTAALRGLRVNALAVCPAWPYMWQHTRVNPFREESMP